MMIILGFSFFYRVQGGALVNKKNKELRDMKAKDRGGGGFFLMYTDPYGMLGCLLELIPYV